MRILVSDPISDEALKLLSSSKETESEYKPDISPADLLNEIKICDAIIVRSRTRVTREVVFAAPNLKVIGRAGVGIDNIDAEAAKERNIPILNTPNALTNSVAEFTIGVMLDLSRRISFADLTMKEGRWDKSQIHGSELKGRTYGTIGIGRIGQRVAEFARAFGMKIMANDVIPIPEEVVSRLEILVSTQDEVLSRADYVDLHVPLTLETENLVNYSKMKLMKKSAFLINTSRGRVVNEMDLIRALDEKIIAGAALDVFETEPSNRIELIKRDNVVATPHIAAQTREAQTLAGVQVVEAVLKFLKSSSS